MKFQEFVAQWRVLYFKGHRPSAETVMTVMADCCVKEQANPDGYYDFHQPVLSRLFNVSFTKDDFVALYNKMLQKRQERG